MTTTAADRKAADELKAEGNALFTKGKFAAAIEKYTEAVTLSPDWPVLYINRGMAARKKGDWERVEADASLALGLVGGSSESREAMKGHYLLGLAMGQRGQHERSKHHLKKALEAAREANDNIKDEIWRELAAANYSNWQMETAARKATNVALRRQLLELLGKQQDEPLPAEWESLFRAAAWKDSASEAPSQFTCPLTMEIFRDPVVAPSGRSYERSALQEHLKKVGKFDPITRQPIAGEEALVANVSLRAAIELFLEEHPWGWGEVK
ncbi:hypothetical protein HXX76_012652 [Chlamydomonas incerta]|uniref:E3 ubiquitin-protein ligase CHIP n=1 Tax=Chlamydomonas incerta TaxID=51695 RepID=A0A835SLD5_CHLIN|nr:hypothetical protein HXX76_012652 [Chlamydomonas incerta]|eukprot:KAG2427142.1 hypothetical protein HXX76_012652 [Chlamydomonas incerta]